MTARLANKVAVVTASTEGIGFAIARRLALDGCKVVVSSRKEANVKKAIERLKNEKLECHGLVCHVGKQEDRKKLIDETISKYGGIDVLVTNAAVNPHFGSAFTIDEASWDKLFEINVKSTFFTIKQALPHMKNRKGASVIIVSSIAGLTPFQMLGPYSITKTALLGLTKAIAPECAQMGIRVNCIAPGIIKTNFSKALWENEDVLDISNQNCPMKRVGDADECAGVASFLASDDASYITGETIVVAGGSPSRL